MKKIFIAALLVIFVLSMNQAVFADRPIKIVVGGELLETDVAPMAIEGRTLLPVRAVFESIGAKVDYIAAEQKVVAVKGDREVSFIIGSNTMTIDGVEKEIDVASQVVNNRTLVPLRACAEAFDLEVNWDNDSKTARVKTEVAVISKYVSPNGQETIFSYDDNGNLTYIDGSCAYFGRVMFSGVDRYYEKYEYDEKGNNTYFESANGIVEKMTYNKYDEMISLENGNGVITTYNYDDNGNLLSKSDTEGNWTNYTYDENNLLQTESDNSGTTVTYAYNDRGQKTEQVVSYSPESSFKTIYEYDERGNLVLEHSLSDDWKFIFEYDSNNNLTHETSMYADMVMVSYVLTYDENGRLIYEAPEGMEDEYREYTYDADGYLTSEIDSNGTRLEYIRIVK